jgi:cytoskeletal protein CcmA (bactofilin family)
VRLAAPALALLLLAAPAAGGGAAEGRDLARARGTIRQDLYVAGPTVDVQAEVIGDVVAAGREVRIGEHVTGDVLVAGGQVTVAGRVEDDIRAAGGTVDVTADTGGDAIVAGGQVRLGPGTQVDGRAWLAGGDVSVDGAVAGDLRAAGATVRIAGHVAGDAHVAARQVEIAETARIDGVLRYRSPREAAIHPAAVVAGGVEATRLQEWDRVSRLLIPAIGVGLLGLFLVGLAIVLLVPGFGAAAAETAAREPWKSAGLGLAVLVLAPAVIVGLLATVVGIPLALAVLALYVVGLLVGLLTGVLWVGRVGAHLLGRAPASRAGWALALLLALVLVALIGAVPFVGPPVIALVMILGLGALTLAAVRTLRRARTTPAG